MKKVLLKRKLGGFEIADLLGILLMFIPCYISIVWGRAGSGHLWWKNSELDIRPDLVSALFASAFYVGLLIRYGMFKIGNVFQVIVTIIRSFLNIWVLSSLVVLATAHSEKLKLKGSSIFSPIVLLLIGIAMTWLGMRAIAGYSWVFFFIATFNRFSEVNSAMNMLGAVYMITIAISMLLQVKDLYSIRNFFYDFNGKISDYGNEVREDILTAKDDAGDKVQTAVEFAESKMPAARSIFKKRK